MNKILLFATTLLFSSELLASESRVIQFGRIESLKGEGFISYKGNAREMKTGDILESGSEISIESHGQVTITDNADHRFHLGNASSATVSVEGLELRSGDLWLQSLNKVDNYKIQTANATINDHGGEAIISYDTLKGKTQLMVINGIMKLSNLRAPELNLNVSEGHFSFIDNAYEEGAPRDPTSVGEKTYKQLVSLFSGIYPMDKNAVMIFQKSEKHEISRAVAEVNVHDNPINQHKQKEEKKVDIDSKMIEDYKDNLLGQSHPETIKADQVSKGKIQAASKGKGKKKENTISKIEKKSLVQIYGGQIYGKSPAPKVAIEKIERKAKNKKEAEVEVEKNRAPASVKENQIVPATTGDKNTNVNKEKESNQLINDLKKL